MLRQRLEVAACAIYLLLLAISFGQFADLPLVTVPMVVSALVALVVGRPLVRVIAIAAFAFPVFTLINDYQQSRPSPASPMLNDSDVSDASSPSQNPSSKEPKQ